ncbi:MAG TPA: energy transducer TonB [Tepidisphaeraceae bacterium]|nr:energy transducer TonB [Tepidisphaeraceae bacterium]
MEGHARSFLASRPAHAAHDRIDASAQRLVYAATAAAWVGCMAIGVGGLILKYPWPHLAAKEPPPVVAERIHVELADNPILTNWQASASPSPAVPQAPEPQPPALDTAEIPPDAPPSIPLAVPSPAIAFAMPQAGRATAGRSRSVGSAHRLVFGAGEGAQPKPEYPRAAILADEQGTVDVRFTVGADGKVTSAQLAVACRWPLLNETAVRAIRDRWRFSPGRTRYYEVSIDFTLSEQ